MELTEKQVSTPAQSWVSRAEGEHPSRADYDSELRSWVKRAVVEAEKNKEFTKKDQLSSLLKDL